MINEFAGKYAFDSRDVQERINELEPTADLLLKLTDEIEEMAADPEHDPDTLRELESDKTEICTDEIDEYNELMELKNGVDSFKPDTLRELEWNYGVQFIADDYFESYARELAEDIGAISKDCQWPATCIDWERAADELKMDYSSVEFGNYTYYYRA